MWAMLSIENWSVVFFVRNLTCPCTMQFPGYNLFWVYVIWIILQFVCVRWTWLLPGQKTTYCPPNCLHNITYYQNSWADNGLNYRTTSIITSTSDEPPTSSQNIRRFLSLFTVQPYASYHDQLKIPQEPRFNGRCFLIKPEPRLNGTRQFLNCWVKFRARVSY